MAGCKACQKKKHHKKHSSSDEKKKKRKEYKIDVELAKVVKPHKELKEKKKKVKGIACGCCSECLCYKYGGKEDWYCKCGCGSCKCGLKVVKRLQKGAR